MFEKLNKVVNEKKCTLLPLDKGEKVIKIDLNHNESETARAILYVAPDGFVREHSHAKQDNADSEVYIDLMDIVAHGTRQMQTVPEVAGDNSPTGRLKHSIEPSQQPQVFLAIKKGQKQSAWKDFERNLPAYLHSLHFGCSLTDGNLLNIISLGAKNEEEFVVIDLAAKQVNYLLESKNNLHNVQEKVTLNGLMSQQKDAGVER